MLREKRELPLGLIRIRADDVLGDRHAVFRQTVLVERPRCVPVPLLFVRGTVTFHGPFVLIWVSWCWGYWLNRHLVSLP
jgi:hypothetical protein